MTVIRGTIYDDFLQGTDEDDRFTPLTGNDVVIGGAGTDTLVVEHGTITGSGSPYSPSSIFLDGASLGGILWASDGSSIISFAEVERITGTLDGGSNLLYIYGYGAAANAFNLDGGGGEDRLSITAELFPGNFEFVLGPNGKAKSTIGTFSNFESYEIALGLGSHHVVTGSGADAIYDYGGSALISTGGGDDLIVSYRSIDAVDGGAGYDRWNADYESETGDLVFAYDGSSGSLSNGALISNVEAVSLTTGSGNDSFTVTAPAELYLNAGSGSDSIVVDFSQEISEPDEVVVGTDPDGVLFGSLIGIGSFVGFEDVTYTTGNGDTYLTLSLQGLAPGAQLHVNAGLGYDTVELNWASTDPLHLSVDEAGNLTSNVGLTLTGFDAYILFLGGGDDIVSAGDGDDMIFGLAGDDRLDGGGGADTIYGGLGADVYVFDELSDFGTDSLDLLASARTDLGDKIDVQALSDDSFTFLGDAAFSGEGIPQLRYDQLDGQFLVQGDIDGDGVADFQFFAIAPSLAASDFFL